MSNISEREILRKAERLDRYQLIDWIIEEEQDNERLLSIIKKYEDYTKASIKKEQIAVYNPKTMEQEVYFKEIITTDVNGNNLKYWRCSR